MTIQTYIINLPTSTVRREYMQKELAPYPFLNIEFLKAVDGRKLSEEELNKEFDRERSLSAYGRQLNAGEIGCSLSHIKAYRTLLDSEHPYALVMEDDIKVIRPLSNLQVYDFDALLRTDTPRILFLSGDYWYWRKERMPRVFDAVGGYAFLINRAAAEVICNSGRPYSVADDWRVYKKMGVQLYAVRPYLIDANCNMEVLGSDVKQDSWTRDFSRISKMEMFRLRFEGAVKKILKAVGRFESKVRIINNKIVEQ